LIPVLAEGGEVDTQSDPAPSEKTDNNVNVGNMSAMQSSAAQGVSNPTLAFSVAANPNFECPSFIRACGAVNGSKMSDPFGGHYDRFADNLS
jgi:hypothetical protein